MLALLFAAVLLVATLVFAAQNPDAVPVRFMTQDLQLSKLAIMFAFLFVGGYLTSFVNEITEISARRLFREFALKIAELEQLLAEKTAQVTELERRLQESTQHLETAREASPGATPSGGSPP